MVQRFRVLPALLIWPGLALCALLTSGCAGPERRSLSFDPPPESSWASTARPAGDLSFIPGKSEAILLPGDTGEAQPMATLAMRGCSIKDRFDRSSTLAYHFNGGQERVELDVSAKGPSFSDPGRFEVKGVAIRFVHKFQNIKSRKERCRFESPVQGLIGSAYNEIYMRQDDTIMHELNARNLDFWD